MGSWTHLSKRISAALTIFPLLVLASTSAHADCPVANQFVYSFTSATAATLSYASTYTYAATNGLGQTQNIAASFIVNGASGTVIGGQQMPAITALINDGGTTNRNLVFGGILGARTPNIAVNTNVFVLVLTFATPIRDFSAQINDIDFTTNQFRDWLAVAGSNGASSYTPSLVTPNGTNNTAAGPHVSGTSSMVVGAATVPVAVTISQAAGTGASGNNSTTGTVNASFVEPVTRVEIRYGNYPLQTGETVTGPQGAGLQSISFCPLPALSVLKSSTPFVTAASDPARFNLPGSDVIYTLTVSNANTSAVDLEGTVLLDLLPPQMTFYNGDIDDAGPIATNFEFIAGSSGLTMAPAGLTYSNNGGSSYGYTPAAGYDAAVNGLRINPKGSFAANSSFTIKFRTRIK